MPLPASAQREHLHTRTIVCEGYAREDGLYDVDGWMTDTKSYDFSNHDRGEIKTGVPLHGMGLRLTLDKTLTIRAVAATMDYTPFNMCPSITPHFQRLVGLNLGKGFSEAVREALGGIQGCVHLVDLLRPIATTAFQTLAPEGYAALKDRERRGVPVPAPFIDRCHAWASDSPVTAAEFPSLFTGKA